MMMTVEFFTMAGSLLGYAVTGTVLAYASIAASLAGAGISAYSAHQQGKAQEKMNLYNAQVAKDAARNEEAVSRENVKRQREMNRRKLASIRGNMAKSGVNLGTGSALDVIGQSAGELEMAALDLFREHDARQRQLTAQAGMSVWQGSQAMEAAKMSAIGTLIGGVGQAAGGYVEGYRSGVIGGGEREKHS